MSDTSDIYLSMPANVTLYLNQQNEEIQPIAFGQFSANFSPKEIAENSRQLVPLSYATSNSRLVWMNLAEMMPKFDHFAILPSKSIGEPVYIGDKNQLIYSSKRMVIGEMYKIKWQDSIIGLKRNEDGRVDFYEFEPDK